MFIHLHELSSAKSQHSENEKGVIITDLQHRHQENVVREVENQRGPDREPRAEVLGQVKQPGVDIFEDRAE